ncbi:MAG: hypothetical protein R3F19_11280 [Verrucomicrobiales bacterium]
MTTTRSTGIPAPTGTLKRTSKVSLPSATWSFTTANGMVMGGHTGGEGKGAAVGSGVVSSSHG